MRRTCTVIALGTLLLAGCSERRHREPYPADGSQNKFGFAEALDSRSTAIDIREEAPRARFAPPAEMAAPGIAVTAAPGVAFNYRYAFVLPDTSISAIQEQHATACEKLGPARCRITGMHYTLVDEDEVRGQLQFKLDPALARQFGKDGIAAVEKAKGRLVDAAIEGNDVGTAIDQSQRRSQRIAAEIAQIEQLLKNTMSEATRADLRSQLERLRQQQTREQDTRSDGEEQLANTPMTFNYAGKQGFSLGDDPIGDAWHSGTSSFTTMVSVILIGLGTALPWALLVALLVAIWRKTPLARLRLRRRGDEQAEPAAEASPASPPSEP